MHTIEFRTSLVSLVAMALIACATPAFAQQKPTGPLVVAIVDVQKILEDSKAAKTVQAALDKQRSSYQADISKQENALRAADQDLVRQRGTLSADAFDKKRQDLEQQAASLRRDVQTKRQQLDRMFQTSMDQIRTSLLQVIDEIAAERGATLVLSKTNVLLAANDYDITTEALKRLNVKLPTVSVEVPK